MVFSERNREQWRTRRRPEHDRAITYLSDDVLDELVDGEADVGVDGEHLPQRVLVLRGLQVAVQEAAHHVQEGRVVLLQLHLTWAQVHKPQLFTTLWNSADSHGNGRELISSMYRLRITILMEIDF